MSRRSLSLVLPALPVALLLAVVACQTVPGTGRKQTVWVPLSMEMGLGADGYQQTLSEAKTITSGPDYEMVQRVGERIAVAAKRIYPEPSLEFDWEIVLIDDPETVNAWCMPGGKMAVYTGLLPVTQDEDSLAAVVGHEVAHAVARHGGERMTHELVLQGVLLGASASMDDMDAGDRDLVLQALVGVGTVGAILPFSRSHESEADELGLYLAADAGYDPHAAIGLWERMAAASKGNAPPEFLSTHPAEATRIEGLKEHMPMAEWYYSEAKKRGA